MFYGLTFNKNVTRNPSSLRPIVTNPLPLQGYFLTVSPDSMVAIGEHAVAANKCFSMNLSAPFLSQFFNEPMKRVLPFCDIVFGNEDEARAFAKDFDINSTDLAEIAKKVAAMPKNNSKRSRIVIFTQGADPAVVYMGELLTFPSCLFLFDVSPYQKSELQLLKLELQVFKKTNKYFIICYCSSVFILFKILLSQRVKLRSTRFCPLLQRTL